MPYVLHGRNYQPNTIIDCELCFLTRTQLTEWACPNYSSRSLATGGKTSAQVQQGFMAAALDYLEAEPAVERHMHYSVVQGPTSWLSDASLLDPATGALTPLGTIFATRGITT